MGTTRVPCHQAGLLAVPRWEPAQGWRGSPLPRRPEATASQTPAGTFRAAGCGPLQPGTARAYGDRIPVPDGVESPRPHRKVPVPDGVECPRPHKNVPARDDMSPDARSAPARGGAPRGCATETAPPSVARPPPHPPLRLINITVSLSHST